MLRYAITSGTHSGTSSETLENARRWSAEGVEYVQLRESHLGAGEQVKLANAMLAIFQEDGSKTKLLINHRADVAIVTGSGVHLTAKPGELTAMQVRQVFATLHDSQPYAVSVSCHTLEDVHHAIAMGADLILFGPVFEKRVAGELILAGTGLEALGRACGIANHTPVLALGGVTDSNAAQCVEAGAAGVAGIRLFRQK